MVTVLSFPMGHVFVKASVLGAFQMGVLGTQICKKKKKEIKNKHLVLIILKHTFPSLFRFCLFYRLNLTFDFDV